MYMRLKEGKQKVLTLSYDDGYVYDRRLIDIFDKYGLSATFNISSGRFYPENGEEKDYRIMKLTEAKELYSNSGHEIALHTKSHKVLTYLKSEQVVNEIMEDRLFAEKEFKRRITGLAYPYGAYNENILKIAEACGIDYSRGKKDTENFSFPENWFEFNPTCHHDNPRLFELAGRFVNGAPKFWNWLFFVWGHSSELEKNNNWDRIEKFSELVGRKDDIWYATNIEIFDYVESWNRLVISADSKNVYNPTSTIVWIEEEEKIYKINPGETVTIK